MLVVAARDAGIQVLYGRETQYLATNTAQDLNPGHQFIQKLR